MQKVVQAIIGTLVVVFSSQLSALKIEGYQKQKDADYQFSKLVIANSGSEFYLAFSTLESEEVSLSLNADGKSTVLAEFSIEPGFTYKYPSNGKSIALEAKGKYTFNAKNNDGEILEL